MTLGWQDLLALAMVMAAVIYVVWRVRRMATGKGESACSGCPTCPVAPACEQSGIPASEREKSGFRVPD